MTLLIVDPKYQPRGCVPYKIPFHLKDQVKTELDKWLEKGIIRKSNSKFCHPVVIVKNSDLSIRITVDYRAVNPHIATDHYPMPLQQVVIDKLPTAKFITKIDLTKAYFNMGLSETSRHITSSVAQTTCKFYIEINQPNERPHVFLYRSRKFRDLGQT
jgi:hypothetical protein